jgi:hypothetical protein
MGLRGCAFGDSQARRACGTGDLESQALPASADILAPRVDRPMERVYF